MMFSISLQVHVSFFFKVEMKGPYAPIALTLRVLDAGYFNQGDDKTLTLILAAPDKFKSDLGGQLRFWKMLRKGAVATLETKQNVAKMLCDMVTAINYGVIEHNDGVKV